jgi:hypothetical protein
MAAASLCVVVDLEVLTAELEARSMALPIEVALFIMVEVLHAAIRARALGPIGPIALRDVVIDRGGGVHLEARPGSGSDLELAGSVSLILFVLLSAERTAGGATPLRALADQGVSDNVIRILARARTRTHRALESFLAEIERWMDLHRMWITPAVVEEILRRHGLVPRPASDQNGSAPSTATITPNVAPNNATPAAS